MKTLDFKPIHKELVESYLVALAYFQLLDNMATPHRERAMQVIQPAYAEKHVERRGDHLGPMTWDTLYMATQADAQNVYDYYNVITDDCLKFDLEGRCPVLMAKSHLNNTICKIIEAFKGLFEDKGPEYDQLLIAGEKVFNEYVDHLVRLTVLHFKIDSSTVLLDKYMEGV